MATQQRLISSQRYRDNDVVEQKRSNHDYVVTVVEIVVDGEEYLAVVDGHHSHAAAIADGVEPVVEIAIDKDLEQIDVDTWLQQKWIDDNWYFLDNGQLVW